MQQEWSGERLETFVFNEVTIEHLHRYAFAKEWVKNKVVLDIACGEGYGSNILSTDAAMVTGVDIDKNTIDNASKKYQKKNLSFLYGSVENIPCDTHSFDVVVSFETLEHTAEHAKMLAEIKRVLKPEGILIISTPEKKAYTDIPGSYNPFHKKELYKEAFIELVSSFFKYHSFLHQNFFLSSFIVKPVINTIKIYEGDYKEIKNIQDIEPLYMIAICSDKEVPETASSIFTGKMVFENALREKEKEVKNTFTYKLGHIILLPAKLIRMLFGLNRNNNNA